MQVGVEALSDSLLARMRKGVRAIDNLAAMKDALENDLRLAGNLILEFPGSTVTEVEETLAALAAALPFPPLEPATFFLGQGCPVDKAPQAFGLTAVTCHANYRALYPATLLDRVPMLVRSGRGDRERQRRLWRPVRQALRAWREFHCQRTSRQPALCYRDGGDFLVIRQERPGQPVLHHRLHGTSRAIYLHCRRPVAQKELLQTFGRVKEEQLVRFGRSHCTTPVVPGRRALSRPGRPRDLIPMRIAILSDSPTISPTSDGPSAWRTARAPSCSFIAAT